MIDGPSNANLRPPGVYYVVPGRRQGLPLPRGHHALGRRCPRRHGRPVDAAERGERHDGTGSVALAVGRLDGQRRRRALRDPPLDHRRFHALPPPTIVGTGHRHDPNTGWQPGPTATNRGRGLGGQLSEPSATPEVAGDRARRHDIADRGRSSAPAGGRDGRAARRTSPPTASDDVGVSGVQFRLDGASPGGARTPSSPYSVNWDTSGRGPGPDTPEAPWRATPPATPTTSAAVSRDRGEHGPPPAPAPIAAFNFEETKRATVADVNRQGAHGQPW